MVDGATTWSPPWAGRHLVARDVDDRVDHRPNQETSSADDVDDGVCRGIHLARTEAVTNRVAQLASFIWETACKRALVGCSCSPSGRARSNWPAPRRSNAGGTRTEPTTRGR